MAMDINTEKMIFIVGMSRSGTTMLGRVMGANKDVYTFEELHFFESLVSSEDVQNNASVTDHSAKNMVTRLLTSSEENIFSEPNAKKWEQASRDVLGGLMAPYSMAEVYKKSIFWYTENKGKSIPCEQTPRYIFSLKDIFHVFPNARIINMTRDPRDVLLSQKNKWRIAKHGSWKMPLSEAARVWSNYIPIIQSIMWRSCVEQAFSALHDQRVISIRYEDITANPKYYIQRICDHVGINYSDAMMNVTKIGSSITPDSTAEKGIDASFAGRWRKGGLSHREIAVCEYYCKEQMKVLGYELSTINGSRLDVFSFIPALLFKGTLALFLNFRRSRSIVTLLKNRLGFQGKV